ncbi:CinA family protein [Phycicoccus sp. Root101]|uniref:CinA family protein n=1 Tax=Phycicoccus sp. Root101 TaxID=1736421 RepID=UPI0009E7A769|nr:CinA family protein [Phycicoccus sp. Root101]
MTDVRTRAEVLAGLVQERGWTVAVAESLTSGAIATELGRGPDASAWFLGGVVVYASRTKFDVLGVAPGPVVSPTAACTMAASAAELFSADLTLAATGVAGPGPESGVVAGTTWLAVRRPGRVESHLFHFDGPPERVVAQTVSEALRLLVGACRGQRDLHPRRPGTGQLPIPSGEPRPVSAPVAADLATTPTWSTDAPSAH